MPKCVELAGAFQKLRDSKVGIYGVTPRYLINIPKVAEETEMAYLADFLALYLSPKSDFRSTMWHRDSRRLVKPEYARK